MVTKSSGNKRILLGTEIFDASSNQEEGFYRHPYYVAFSRLVVPVIFLLLPFLNDGETIFWITGSVISIGLSSLALVYAIYLFLYSVRVNANSVKVRGFVRRRFNFSDITEVRFPRDRAAPRAFVKLIDGRAFTFDARLVGYKDLVEKLERR